MAKISVIVAVYNVEKYIIKCLESVKKQTFSDFECLIISDGSKDNSVSLAKDFINDDSRFKIIKKENGGYGSVLERGIKEAEGDYILICDPDDYLADYALEHLYNCALSNCSDLVVGSRYDIYENPHEEIYSTGYDTFKYNLKGIKTYKNKDKNFSMFFSFDCSPHSKLFKKSMIYDGPYPHNVGYTDMILFCLTMNKVKTITYTDKPCSYYLLEREGNTMTASKDKFVKSHFIILDEMLNGIDDNFNTQSYLCVLDTFKYCVSFLSEISEKELYVEEFQRIFKRLFNKQKCFKKYLKYAQGGKGSYVYSRLLFNKLFGPIYLKFYLNKNCRKT